MAAYSTKFSSPRGDNLSCDEIRSICSGADALAGSGDGTGEWITHAGGGPIAGLGSAAQDAVLATKLTAATERHNAIIDPLHPNPRTTVMTLEQGKGKGLPIEGGYSREAS